jgi:hypothetical protein
MSKAGLKGVGRFRGAEKSVVHRAFMSRALRFDVSRHMG